MKAKYNSFIALSALFILVPKGAQSQCPTAGLPYYEGFSGITLNNQLPACWAASNLGGTCTTSTLNGGSASFYYLPINTSYFYSPAIQLNSSVTYSAALWFKTESIGYTNWSNLSLLYGTTQSAVGLTTITTIGPAVSPVFTSLSNTFTVSTPGVYYIAVRGMSSGACCAYNLTWDDLSVTAPCSLNQPVVTVAATATAVCSGQSVTLSAFGANTYAWNNGSTSSVCVLNPTVNNQYAVIGTNTASACSTTVTGLITVNPNPAVFVVASSSSLCAGNSVILNAAGATNYLWYNGSTSSVLSLTPSSSSTYSVVGYNNLGCATSASTSVQVMPLPIITVASIPTTVCAGASATLISSGATSYTWSSSSGLLIGSPVIVNPQITSVYTLTGEDGQGCTSVYPYVPNVAPCLGVKENSGTQEAIKIYPNPFRDIVTLELTEADLVNYEVSDALGRVLLKVEIMEPTKPINLGELNPGVYYLKINSNKKTVYVKLIKE